MGLLDELVEQIKRCETIKQQYKKDNNKVFDFISIENSIHRAKQSLNCNDIIEQLECFEELKRY